jgi:ABC-type bacteriocin/lantibiotic exporter with double-glycine peptidase domain
MTSLSQAFEQFDDQIPEPQMSSPPPRKNAPKTPQYSADISPEEVSQPPQISHQSPQASIRQVPQYPEKFTNYYNYQEQTPQQQYSRTPEYSFWDRMVMSRREVLKLFILSLVVILAISLEKIGCHYLYNYISSTDLTTLQEFLVRLSFPIIVFIILWIIKSF